ncbi:UNVERIFIED_CONTAM: Gag-Pol polyprotein [Sesamum latifolium]|uniref:Gag-Pol polyprotein n=1 Tax=Sesamum latifolium TaxID=2727402 RepID=A0AAW2X7R9_9LAMI
MDEIKDYLERNQLPDESNEAQRIRRLSAQFFMEDGYLFKRSFTLPALRCLKPEEAWEVMKEIHEGCYGNHAGGRSLAQKIMRHGYFWPTIKRDSMQLVRKCAQCQIHGNPHHTPGVKIELAKPTWPFGHWGIDLVGPFPPSQRKKKFLMVIVDHFSKWIEAEPITRVTESAMIQFVWRNILCRFGIPRKITSDNGTQFQGKKFKGWCAQWKIR